MPSPMVDDGAPLGELGAELGIFGNAVGEAVEAFGDGFAVGEGQGLRPLVELDAGNGARRLDDVDQRRAVPGLLAERLVEQDDAGDVVLHGIGGGEQHLAIVAAVVLGRLER